MHNDFLELLRNNFRNGRMCPCLLEKSVIFDNKFKNRKEHRLCLIINLKPNSFLSGQFTNPANPAVPRATTGTEIWENTYDKLSVFGYRTILFEFFIIFFLCIARFC